MKILSIGEIIFDVFNGEAEIGGAPLNFCAHCASLGAESTLVSAVGNDALAFVAMEKLHGFGVNSAFVQHNGFPTGQCIVTMNDSSPEYNVLRPAAYDKIRAENNAFSADVFTFGTLIQRDEESRNAVKNILSKGSFKEIFCDVNLRKNCYDEESCRLCLENATILKVSAEEEPLLADFGLYKRCFSERETVESICESYENIKLVLYTKGENGSLIYDRSEKEFYDVPAVETKVVSTVGAGDSYSAAFLCEYLKNGDIRSAGEAGAKLSAFVVSCRGAVPEK